MKTKYANHVPEFQRHCEILIRQEYPSALGGVMQVGHHLLRRLNHSAQLADPHIIVPLTAKQHDEIHAPNPTISVKELLFEGEVCVGCVFDYHGKEFRWSNKRFVEAWNAQ